jgi:hypothetical protein
LAIVDSNICRSNKPNNASQYLGYRQVRLCPWDPTAQGRSRGKPGVKSKRVNLELFLSAQKCGQYLRWDGSDEDSADRICGN